MDGRWLSLAACRYTARAGWSAPEARERIYRVDMDRGVDRGGAGRAGDVMDQDERW